MKAIILAAGKGSRISEKIGGIPKSTIRLEDGTPIIRKMIKQMLDKRIEPIVCVGYNKQKIFEALEGLPVKYIDNPFYSLANNIVSLWFAKEEFADDDIILSSADLYYPPDFLDKLIAQSGDLAMIVDSARIESGDFYFNADGNFIEEYGPDVYLDNRSFEYMGLTKIDKKIVSVVKDKIESYIEEEKFGCYFEDMIISLNQKERLPISFVDVAGTFWREFDFYEDYMAILEYERNN